MEPESSTADPKFLRALVERIRAGRCVLLIGPGVAVDVSGTERIPIATLLARRLASDPVIQPRCSPDMEGNLRYVAQLHYEVKRDLEDLALVIADFYQGLKGKTTEFHRNLAQLPFLLCITTSADDYMLEALRATGTKNPVAAHYNFRKALDPMVQPPTEIKPLVYYLYGRSEDLYSLVLTESDLIEFLVAVVRGDPALPHHVRGRLGDPDTTFLFVGFGFQNWYLRVLLHVLKIYGHRSRAIALEDTSFFSHPERGQTVGFFSGDRSIEFRALQWDAFAEQLCAAYRATVPADANGKVVPSPEAPKAFLCYASEDREAVEALGEALEMRGVAIWRDKQNLRAGDNWDRALIDVIRKQVDYVVVAQSARMANRAEGYFRKEIEVALDRRSKFDKSFVFVLPVALSGGHVLPELEELHTIEVATDAGIDTLAKIIKDDWAKPHRHPEATLTPS
jgi:hypothetical protein